MQEIDSSPSNSFRPKRMIAVFSRYLMAGGEETSVARIANDLETAGHQITRFWKASEEWTKPGAPPKWKQPFHGYHNPKVLDELRAMHEKVKADAWIVHNVVPVVSLGIYRLALELDVPILQWLHNYRPISPSGLLRAGGRALEPDDPWLVFKEIAAGSWRGRLLTTWLSFGYWRLKSRNEFDSVKAWIAVSEDVKKTFMKAGFPQDRMFALKHSWDFRPSRRTDSDGGYFLYLGRMVEEKGARFLVELFQQPEFKDIEIILGGEGPVADQFRGKTPPNIRWTGFVRGEEKLKLVAGARAVLSPCTWREPLSTVVYEAYEQECPVITNALGGMNDMILDGQTGRLLSPGDMDEWKRVVMQLAQQPELSRVMGKRGRQWLEENVSREKWTEGFQEILDTVLSREPQRRR